MTVMDPISSLRRATAVEKIAPLRYVAQIPDGWQQGRGAFGGLVLGTMVRAVCDTETESERVVRTVSATFAGPVATGEAHVQVRPVRSGSGVSTFTATMSQGAETLAEAIVVLAKTRITDREWNTLERLVMPPFEETIEVPVAPPLGPVFSQHFVYRSAGALPMSSSPIASSAGYITTRVPLESIDAPEIVAYADTWWPAAYARESMPRPMATISFSLQITADLSELDPRAPLFMRSRADVSHAGFVHEVRELWSQSGELVAINPQTFVFVK